MTDRIHSCKQSPDGRHDWEDVTNPFWKMLKTTRVYEQCRYCLAERSHDVPETSTPRS